MAGERDSRLPREAIGERWTEQEVAAEVAPFVRDAGVDRTTPTGTRVDRAPVTGTIVGPPPTLEGDELDACDAFRDFSQFPMSRFCGRCRRCRDARGER